MTNARRLSKLDIAISFIKALRNLLPIIILFSIKVKDLEGMKLIVSVSIVSIVVIALAVSSYLEWRKFQYSLQQDHLIIQKGVFKREEKTIYYNRIHSVNVQQPLLLRIFGVASLQIETPGGQPGKAEGELRVLKHAYALELQNQLKQLRQAEQLQSQAQVYRAEQARLVDQLTGKAQSNPGNHEQVLQAGQVNIAVSEEQSNLEKQAEGVQQAGLGGQDGQDGQDGQHGQHNLADPIKHADFVEQATIHPSSQLRVEEEQPDYQYRLSFGQLLKASLTSLNLNFAFIFIFGIYSFADDVLDIISPGMYDRVIDNVIDQTSALPILILLLLTVLVIGGVWLLSIAIYLIKFGDYQISRSHEQLSVSYGLLEKKSYIFDQNKVQAVIMEENPLRQWLGFAEIRVQVVTSNALEQLVIHPFARKKDIGSIMKELLPDYRIELRKELNAPPPAAYRSYAIFPTVIGLLLTAGAVWLWKWSGLWLLLLLPIIWAWSLFCMRSSGVWLEGNDLTLRKRKINAVTYFVRRKNIVTLRLKSTPMQRKRELHNIHVQVLGSALSYGVKGIGDQHVLPIWAWYSRNGKRNSIEQ